MNYHAERAAREAAESRIKELEQEIAERDASFDLRRKADQRAIERWREQSTMGSRVERDLMQPDHADLCMFLINELETNHHELDMAIDSAVGAFLAKPHEVYTHPDGGGPDYPYPDEWDEKVFARLQWFEDPGDWEVGIPPVSGFALAADQSGTVVGDMIDVHRAQISVLRFVATFGEPFPRKKDEQVSSGDSNE